MKRRLLVLAILAVVAVVAMVVLPLLQRAKAYTGPNIAGNLRLIQMAKDQLMDVGNTNEWPSSAALFSSSEKPLNERMRRRFGELYFINRTGAPPFAYIPKAAGHFRGGEILVLKSNAVMVVNQ